MFFDLDIEHRACNFIQEIGLASLILVSPFTPLSLSYRQFLTEKETHHCVITKQRERCHSGFMKPLKTKAQRFVGNADFFSGDVFYLSRV